MKYRNSNGPIDGHDWAHTELGHVAKVVDQVGTASLEYQTQVEGPAAAAKRILKNTQLLPWIEYNAICVEYKSMVVS